MPDYRALMQSRDEDHAWRLERDMATEKYGTADDLAKLFGPPTGTADAQRGAPAEASPGARVFDNDETKDER